MLDALRGFERREATRFGCDGDDTPTGVAFGREPAARPLAGAKQSCEGESSSER
jgi:hypothetical protein